MSIVRTNDQGKAQVLGNIAKWIVLIFFFTFTFIPLLWLLISSFKTNLELQLKPFAMPKIWQFTNYANAVKISGLPRLFLNSIMISTVSTGLTMIVTSMAGFVFSRERFPFRQGLLNLILAGVLVPIIALMAPYFRLTNALGIYDSIWALIFTYTAINIPISTFLLYGFMRTLPRELEEAAIMDGTGFVGRYWRIILPLTKPGMVTAGTFVFLFSWNEFIYAMLLTSRPAVRTLQLGIRFFTSQFFTDYTSMFAAIVLTMLPTIIIYIVLHEQIIKGMTSGALKG
ncbi:MAG: carbohydrate ABC transporter permease [Spirochaetes bacterium]|nr:MAG: carbohydrate ABC transporter permease [Spirochaetota bacterium]RKX98987.1 MAG: carbohydrate ABC transporter permease [Spirochaetota bacterium]